MKENKSYEKQHEVKILVVLGVIAFLASFVVAKYELVAIAGGLRGFGLVAAVLGYAKLYSPQDQLAFLAVFCLQGWSQVLPQRFTSAKCDFY